MKITSEAKYSLSLNSLYQDSEIVGFSIHSKTINFRDFLLSFPDFLICQEASIDIKDKHFILDSPLTTVKVEFELEDRELETIEDLLKKDKLKFTTKFHGKNPGFIIVLKQFRHIIESKLIYSTKNPIK